MTKTAVKVFVRTRPTASSYEGLKVQQEVISIRVPKAESDGLINNNKEQFSFKFDGILENSSQESMYTSTTHEVVDNVLSGINGTVFCYGQTGAGKTFTMSGDLRHYQHRGLIPQAIHHVFREIDMRVDKMYTVHVSYLELYNDQMYDLLSENPGDSDSLAVLEDANGGTYVRGLSKIKVTTEEEALMQYFAGDQGRSTAGHVLNSHSSRSHCIFTVHLEIRTSEAASERAVLSKLNMVDLAGSERTKKTGAKGQTLVEAQFINRSLSFLEQTVNALSKRESYVPYRQSKLTSVLRDALGGNCKTVMIANIYGEHNHITETLSTLRFASRVRMLVTDIGVNESSDPSLLLRRCERQIKELKQELAMRDALSGRSRISYDDMSDAEVRELNALARRFLNGSADIEELPSDTLKSIREAYKQMRAVFQAMSADLRGQLTELRSDNEVPAVLSSQGNVSTEDGSGKVGNVDRGGHGFAVGTAPSDARPPEDSSTRFKASPTGKTQGPEQTLSSARPDDDSEGLLSGNTMLTASQRNAAFSRFKKELDEGRSLNKIVLERSAHLAELKKHIKEATGIVNLTKQEIDAANAQLGAKKSLAASTGPDDGSILDSEQYALLRDLKAAKIKYRTEFDRLKELRSAMEPAIIGVAEAKQGLIDEFNKWVGSPQGTFTLAQPEDNLELDAGEAFERMQINRIIANNPDSAAFMAAKRKTLTGSGTAGGFGGVKGKSEATRRLEHEQAIAAGVIG